MRKDRALGVISVKDFAQSFAQRLNHCNGHSECIEAYKMMTMQHAGLEKVVTHTSTQILIVVLSARTHVHEIPAAVVE